MTSGLKYTAIAVLCMGLDGCLFFPNHKPQPVQTPPQPTPAELKPPPPKVEPLPGPAPKIETKPPEVPSAVAVAPNPPAPHKRKPKKPVVASTGTAQSPPIATTPDPTPPPVTIPKLGEILSDDQKLQYQKICDESVLRAKGSLALLRGYTLTSDQKQSVTRINAFIKQAEQARNKDPQTARQLAERADLLSRDLVQTVR